jgi:poly(A) polymerase
MVRVSQRPTLHSDWIDRQALEIVRQLQRSGYTTYLVGGCVRDLLVGIHPKDFDIATNAEPNQIRKKIYHAYVIGNRFRLVLARRGDKQFEIATFRKETKKPDVEDPENPVFGDNTFGTPEEDALRRDFTINGLFYDPIKNELIDYCNGLDDIAHATLRMIGDPDVRIAEDAIRSLRAIRLSHKINFQIEPNLRKSIAKNAGLLEQAILPRKREEYLKILRIQNPVPALLEMKDLEVLKYTLPTLDEVLQQPEKTEIFLEIMEHYNALCIDRSSSVNLYLPLVYTVYKIFPDNPQVLENFMRNELGIFRAEQMSILHAIEMMTKLPKVESFKKRSHRRQNAFAKLQSLPLALQLLEFEKTLPVSELAFWKSLILRNPNNDDRPVQEKN